jgi:hypothetical protein
VLVAGHDAYPTRRTTLGSRCLGLAQQVVENIKNRRSRILLQPEMYNVTVEFTVNVRFDVESVHAALGTKWTDPAQSRASAAQFTVEQEFLTFKTP